jgi:integrase
MPSLPAQPQAAAVKPTRGTGRFFRRCSCRDPETKRQLGTRCPRLPDPDHGQWYFAVQVTGLDGYRAPLRRGGFESRADAESRLAAVLALPGPQALAATWTLRQWLEHWLVLTEQRLRPSTVRAYRQVVHHDLFPTLGQHRLVELGTAGGVATVQRAVDALGRRMTQRGELIAPGTVHRIVAVLRSALSEARRDGLITLNPAWRLRLPGNGRVHAVVWSPERESLWRATGDRPTVAVWDLHHVIAFLEGVRDDPLFPLWWLVVVGGLRRSEVAELRIGDCDFIAQQLQVHRQQSIIDGEIQVGPPKSATSVRDLAVEEFTNGLLRGQARWQLTRPQGMERNPRGHLFTNPQGRPVRPDWLTHRFNTLVRQLGLPPVRLHDLRHGAASLAGAAGCR